MVLRVRLDQQEGVIMKRRKRRWGGKGQFASMEEELEALNRVLAWLQNGRDFVQQVPTAEKGDETPEQKTQEGINGSYGSRGTEADTQGKSV